MSIVKYVYREPKKQECVPSVTQFSFLTWIPSEPVVWVLVMETTEKSLTVILMMESLSKCVAAQCGGARGLSPVSASLPSLLNNRTLYQRRECKGVILCLRKTVDPAGNTLL